MKDIFKDLVGIEGVHGALVLDPAGGLIAKRFSETYQKDASAIAAFHWGPFVSELGELTEADFVFDQGRIYLRKLQNGFFLVIMDDIAPIAMVRLNCEILMPELDSMKNFGSRIGRIFKKKFF